MIFSRLYILQKLEHDFLKVQFSKFALCSTNFYEICRISTCIRQTSRIQISAKLVKAVLRYEFFLSLYSPKTLNTIFSKVHFSKFAIYMFVFQVSGSNMPCILLEHTDMCAYYLILGKIPYSFFRHR